MVGSQRLAGKVIDVLLSADSVDDFDDAVKVIVFGHVVPVIRRMVEDRKMIEDEKPFFYVGRP